MRNTISGMWIKCLYVVNTLLISCRKAARKSVNTTVTPIAAVVNSHLYSFIHHLIHTNYPHQSTLHNTLKLSLFHTIHIANNKH